jgi:macrolide-specific efflux system membrane fusion protein
MLEVFGLPEGIRMGEPASIVLTFEKRENVIVIPRMLVNSFANRKFVNVLNDGIREERDIEVGIQNNTEVEVIKGLEEGELLIRK